MGSFLGTGWSFPVQFIKESGGCRAAMVSEVADIEQSLALLLSTRPGERVMRPDYGCALEDMLFEPLDEGLIAFIREMITNAVLFYEPRVDLQEVDIVTDYNMIQEGRVLIRLSAVVRKTNGRLNMVYDYYKREKTN
jgi:phage baseplate assembly protein W